MSDGIGWSLVWTEETRSGWGRGWGSLTPGQGLSSWRILPVPELTCPRRGKLIIRVELQARRCRMQSVNRALSIIFPVQAVSPTEEFLERKQVIHVVTYSL